VISRRAISAVAGVLALMLAMPAQAFTINEVKSAGVTAWLVEDHSLPIVSFTFLFSGGGALDPTGKSGLATLATDLLDEGAGDLDSEAFHRRVEDLAISLSFSSTQDAVAGSFRSVSANVQPACELVRLALTQPRFEDVAVTRVRNQLIASVARDERQPNFIADRLWRQSEFGNHPYARSRRGTAESLGRITADDMRKFVHDRFARNVLLVAVVGDITPEALKELMAKTFGGLPAEAGVASVPDVAYLTPDALTLARLPIPQSVVAFGEPGIKRDDPDWYAALIDNQILGGGSLTSRLAQEVREKRGLAYSVFSALEPMEHGAMIYGGVATENARVAQSIDIIRAEWKRMHDEGPTAKELADTKTYLNGSFPLGLDSTAAISSTLLVVMRDKLGIDYFDRRSGLIDGVSLDDAKRVAKRLFDPDALSFVVVGAPAALPGAHEVSANGG
jgi:zinc protease